MPHRCLLLCTVKTASEAFPTAVSFHSIKKPFQRRNQVGLEPAKAIVLSKTKDNQFFNPE